MVREGLLQGARRRPDGVGQGDHARLPQAGQGAPPRRQPRARRSASRRSARPTTCSVTPRSARSTTRSARTARSAASAAAGAAAAPSAWRTWATWATSSGACSAGGRADAHDQRGPQRGADMEAQLHLSFQDAVHGVTTSVNVPQEVRCSNCRGSGAAPGTSTHTCPRCGGPGASTTTRACSP